MAASAAVCPTNAIRQDEQGRYFIDQSRCIKCDACREVQPDAIVKLHVADSLPVAQGRVPELASVG